MILIAMFVTAVLFFLAGMHFATWDQNRDVPGAVKGVWWAIGLAAIGLYNMVSLVGLAARV